VRTQDLKVFDVTKDAVVSRQAQVQDQLPPISGVRRATFTPALPTPPEWWAEAHIPLDDVQRALPGVRAAHPGSR
jgi:hypothetical protein